MNILVAGIGNMFLGDDGFGPAVADAMRARVWPHGVDVVDFGIRGMDLAYALTSGLDAAILVDAVARGGAPGTLYTIEPAIGDAVTGIETHAMDPVRVLAFARTLGELPRWMRVVGCEPARLDDDGEIAPGLSAVMTAAIEPAIVIVERLIAEAAGRQLELEARCTS